MPNNKISGKYILQSQNTVATYEFTNNNRSASVVVDDNVNTKWTVLSNGSQSLNSVDFLTKNKIHLKGVRVITPGGAGLRSRLGRSGLITLYVKDSSTEKAFKIVEFAKYNEWQSCDEYLEPYNFTKETIFDLKIGYALFNIDDYNIQEKYIGETTNFFVELDIETAGLSLDGTII